MSYCVNCGVELAHSIKKCPLCKTPVINPNELKQEQESLFPEKIGKVEYVKRHDLVVLISVVLACVVISCTLLNYLSFNRNRWSLLVTGFCGIMWTMTVPPLLVEGLKKRIYTLILGIMVCIYIVLIGMFTDSFEWVMELGLPITLIFFFLVEIFLTVGRHKRTFLVLSLTFFSEVACLCVAIELLICRFIGLAYSIHWSAIVLTVCAVIVVTLITMLSHKRLRNAIHRRFHV